MRPKRYRKEQDEELLCLIREILDERKTLGYRRILVYLNRRLEAEGCAKVNHKRLYRIMRVNGLLLAKYSGKRPNRAHDDLPGTFQTSRNLR
jgi:transposase InsO family protein